MKHQYQVQVFGKPGCDKCARLNRRLDKMLAKEEWQAFEKVYFDLHTEAGLVAFCEAECINPQRIPALLVTRWNADKDQYEPVPNPAPGAPDPLCGKSRLFQHLGLQTDYSAGGGVLAPKMLAAVLQQARAG